MSVGKTRCFCSIISQPLLFRFTFREKNSKVIFGGSSAWPDLQIFPHVPAIFRAESHCFTRQQTFFREDNLLIIIFLAISLLGGLFHILIWNGRYGGQPQSSSSKALKSMLEKVCQRAVLGMLTGTLVTSVIKSSTATIVLTVGARGAGILNLRQSARASPLGANIRHHRHGADNPPYGYKLKRRGIHRDIQALHAGSARRALRHNIPQIRQKPKNKGHRHDAHGLRHSVHRPYGNDGGCIAPVRIPGIYGCFAEILRCADTWHTYRSYNHLYRAELFRRDRYGSSAFIYRCFHLPDRVSPYNRHQPWHLHNYRHCLLHRNRQGRQAHRHCTHIIQLHRHGAVYGGNTPAAPRRGAELHMERSP